MKLDSFYFEVYLKIVIYFIVFCSFLAQGEKSLEMDQISLEPVTEININTSKPFRTFWKTNFKINIFSDRSTSNSVLSNEIYGKVNWDISDRLSFHTQSLIIGRSGFTQSIYDRADRKNGFYLLDGYFDWEITPEIFFKIGSIKQDFLKAPLFITDKTFPSLVQNLTIPFSENSKLSFIFQQSIPDNATETVKRETQIVRWTPLFLTSTAFLDLDSISSWDISLEERLTGFYFTNLSAAVAELGRIRGNTIDLTGSDSRFKYKFLGLHNSINLKATLLEDWVVEFGGDILFNVLAPDTFNQGERFYMAIYHNYKNYAEIKASGEYFANQSDTSVAYYNSEVYGHNNRVGGLLKLQTHLYNSGITIGMTYVYSRPINPKRSSIGVSNSFAIFFGTNYVSI